jgi:hypothetical protein
MMFSHARPDGRFGIDRLSQDVRATGAVPVDQQTNDESTCRADGAEEQLAGSGGQDDDENHLPESH